MTLLDKGFFGADLLLRIQAETPTVRRSSRNTKGLWYYTELERYGDGDRLLQMTVLASDSQKKNPALPTHFASSRSDLWWQAGKTVFTASCPWRGVQRSSGGDPVPRARWEIELGYRDIKSAMQHNAITLKQESGRCYRELWGLLLGYQSGQAGGQPDPP